jgi:hypothetical protein
LRLAGLHSHAVDYPKSGIPAIMSKNLAPKIWPHFMERKQKKSYNSTGILGQLYDMVEREDFAPKVVTAFDYRILNAFDLKDDMLEQARALKVEYDASMKRIMARHAIKTEFEVWSAFVMSHNQEKKDYTFAEELGILSQSIKDKFQKLCIEAAGGKQFEKLGRFVAAIYTVTAQEFEKSQMLVDESWITSDQMPLISFPWIFDRELGRIATGHSLDERLIAIQGKQQRLHSKASPFAANRIDGEVLLSKGLLSTGEFLKLFDEESPHMMGQDTATQDVDDDDMISVDLDRKRFDGQEDENGLRTPASLLYEASEQNPHLALPENGQNDAMDDLLVFDDVEQEAKPDKPVVPDEDLLMFDDQFLDDQLLDVEEADLLAEKQNRQPTAQQLECRREETTIETPNSGEKNQKPNLNLPDDEILPSSSCENSAGAELGESSSSVSGSFSPRIPTPVSSVPSHLTIRPDDVSGDTVVLVNDGPSLFGRLRTLMNEASL